MSASRENFDFGESAQVIRHEQLFLSENLSDIVFRVGGQLLHAHKVILSTASELFHVQFNEGVAGAMQYNRENPIVIENITPETFKEVLRYIYCRQVDLTADNIVEIYSVSQKYLLNGLKSICKAFLMDILNEKTVLNILNTNRLCKLEDVDKLCLEIVKDNPIKFFKDENFLTLSQSALELIASCRHMNCKKAHLCEAIQKWSKANNSEVDIKPEWEALQCRKLFAFSTFHFAQQVSSISTEIKINVKNNLHLYGLGVFVGKKDPSCTPSVRITVKIDSWISESKTILMVDSDLYVEEMLFEKYTVTGECRISVQIVSRTHCTNLFYIDGFKPVDAPDGITVTDMSPTNYGNGKTNCVAYLLYNLDPN